MRSDRHGSQPRGSLVLSGKGCQLKLKTDPAVASIIKAEEQRQNAEIELIASENYVSKAVLAATGSVLTNKYAEGYPGRRYYGGTEQADQIELLAIRRLCQLFKVNYANVQPHSGTQANNAAYLALIKPGQKILGLALAAGGHLSHGYRANFSGLYYQAVSYDVDQQGRLDYDQIEKIARRERPALIVAGYSAYPRQIDWARFRQIADRVGAYLVADIAHIAGLVATGMHPSPVGHAHVITSTTHKTLRGARGGVVMTNDPDLARKIDRAVFPFLQGGPLMHAIAGKAVTFGEALLPDYKLYIQRVVENAQALARALTKLGAQVVTGGTDTHLLTVDVKKSYGLTGQQAAAQLEEHGIIANKNMVPGDSEPPTVTSGVRLGTPAMTTRGFGRTEFEKLAQLIDQI
ncbi:uncharacterized protein LOC111627286 [Centruroides sculpturatus]|uniref:uncharacterized protein LOC111627286 n=1 Tax=Centruroides sculpturatus TaxID=218467 RepID=UPI000C6EC5BE|nr:uncharacterized protein LOC111627286 [Centruroides sculpturatus]